MTALTEKKWAAQFDSVEMSAPEGEGRRPRRARRASLGPEEYGGGDRARRRRGPGRCGGDGNRFSNEEDASLRGSRATALVVFTFISGCTGRARARA